MDDLVENVSSPVAAAKMMSEQIHGSDSIKDMNSPTGQRKNVFEYKQPSDFAASNSVDKFPVGKDSDAATPMRQMDRIQTPSAMGTDHQLLPSLLDSNEP